MSPNDSFNQLMATLSANLEQRAAGNGLPFFFRGGITAIDYEVNVAEGGVKFKISGPDGKLSDSVGLGLLGVGPGCIAIEEGDKEFIAGIVFGETSVVRAPDNEAVMAQARQWIAEIACRRDAYAYQKFPSGLATSQKPDSTITDPNIRARWQACLTAQKNGKTAFDKKESAGTDTDALHYFMWASDNGKRPRARNPGDPAAGKWPYDQADKIEHVYGPFIVDNVGSTPKAKDIHIFVYKGVP